MKDVGYVIVAYVGAALLYAGYALWLRMRERALERGDRARTR